MGNVVLHIYMCPRLFSGLELLPNFQIWFWENEKFQHCDIKCFLKSL